MSLGSLIIKATRQKAVWWTATPNGYGGFLYSVPVEIMCRFTLASRLVTTKENETVMPSGEYLLREDATVAIGDFLWLGELYALPAPVDNAPANGARRVIALSVVYDVKLKTKVIMASVE